MPYSSDWRVTKSIATHTVRDENGELNDYPGVEISLKEADGHNHDAAIQIYSDSAEEIGNLVLAAPDLYEALKALTYGDERSVTERFRAAETALAKAEGR